MLNHITSDNSFMNELIPTLDCIFGPYGDINPKINKIVKEYRQNVKDEDVLCMQTSPERILESLDLELKLLKNWGFFSSNRKDCEMFSHNIQIITSLMIHDDENMLFLSNLKPNAFYKRCTLSFVQGHVSYPEDTTMTLREVLFENMKREFEEELGVIGNGEVSFKFQDPKTYIYLPVEPSSNKHCCVLYELHVPDVSVFYPKEIDKNSLFKIRTDQLHTQYNHLCPWVLHSLSKSDYVKMVYLNYLEKFV